VVSGSQRNRASAPPSVAAINSPSPCFDALSGSSRTVRPSMTMRCGAGRGFHFDKSDKSFSSDCRQSTASVEKVCAVFRKNRCENKKIERRFYSEIKAAALLTIQAKQNRKRRKSAQKKAVLANRPSVARHGRSTGFIAESYALMVNNYLMVYASTNIGQ
jgi:hypothetical protein